MASNYLTVKTHLSEFRNGSDRDTMSEASESGTSNSLTSAEDLQKLAVILGLNSADEVYQEKFRVDRRRLEAMLAENLEESQTAQAFFHRVMNETNTLINWPARLKIGARSKKDPHVRISGKIEDVKLARGKIIEALSDRNNRVTMKIDVSYTDHSHIIGKGGLTIKRVMEETGCHIHFPDSNRTSTQEKSNQVSIAGEMQSVERARARVRILTPLVFCFELPVAVLSQGQPDFNSPYVQQIQDRYNVQVMIRNRPKLHAYMIMVKGQQWETEATMEATTMLMNYMWGSLASQTQVQMSMEISPMHRSVVAGRDSEQLKVIMRGTGTKIMFPDADDPNISSLRKSNVTITGQIKDVYAARQQLVGCLPLVVIFDVAEEICHVDNDDTARLMEKYRVYISVRRKPKQGIVSVVIKGIERRAGDIYEARRELLGGRAPFINPEIPDSYNIPAIQHTMPNFAIPFNTISPQGSPYNIPTPMFNTPSSGFAPLSPVMTSPVWMIPSPQPRPGQFHFPPTLSAGGPMMYNGMEWNGIPSTSTNLPCLPMPSERNMPMPSEHRHLLNSTGPASSGYQSNFTGSSASLDTQNISALGGDASNVASPSVSPISKAQSPTSSTDNDRTNQELATLISEMPLSERRAVGCEKKTLETLKMSPLSDYRHLKAEANKAMRENIGSGYRVPTNRWSGFYFSHTSPKPLDPNEPEDTTTNEKGWNMSELSRPYIVETAPSPPKRCRYRQLYDLLRDIGLQKYIDIFEQQEFDMSTFVTLTDTDLLALGVTAFGARRKIMLVINDLKKQREGANKSNGTPNERKLINSPPQYNTAQAQEKW